MKLKYFLACFLDLNLTYFAILVEICQISSQSSTFQILLKQKPVCEMTVIWTLIILDWFV